MKIIQYMLGFRNADGGVVRAVIDLCNALAARGHDVIVLTTDTSDAPSDWDGRSGRPALHNVTFSRWTRSLLSRGEMARARELFVGADVIHLHVPWDPVCAQLARLARRMRIPYVLTAHGMLDDWTMASKRAKKRAYLALFGKRLLEGAAFVQCCAQAEMGQSKKWYPRGRSIVVPLFFDLKQFKDLPGPDQARRKFAALTGAPKNILYVGRLHPIKRIEMLIQSAQHLKATPGNVLLAGSGEATYEHHLRNEVARRKLSDRIHFLGFVGGEDKLSLFQAADIVVHPSAHESFGLAMVEALACGTPLITTKAVNIWPELQQSGGAIIADQSAHAIARALEDGLHDSQKLARMGRTGREWVFNHLESDRVSAEYEQMYRQAIAQR